MEGRSVLHGSGCDEMGVGGFVLRRLWTEGGWVVWLDEAISSMAGKSKSMIGA